MHFRIETYVNLSYCPEPDVFSIACSCLASSARTGLLDAHLRNNKNTTQKNQRQSRLQGLSRYRSSALWKSCWKAAPNKCQDLRDAEMTNLQLKSSPGGRKGKCSFLLAFACNMNFSVMGFVLWRHGACIDALERHGGSMNYQAYSTHLKTCACHCHPYALERSSCCSMFGTRKLLEERT